MIATKENERQRTFSATCESRLTRRRRSESNFMDYGSQNPSRTGRESAIQVTKSVCQSNQSHLLL